MLVKYVLIRFALGIKRIAPTAKAVKTGNMFAISSPFNIWSSINKIIPAMATVILRSVTYYAFAEVLKLPNYMRGMGDIKWMLGIERSEDLKSLILDLSYNISRH